MKLRIGWKGSLALAGVAAAVAVAWGPRIACAEGSPYEDGVKRVILTKGERDLLIRYADNSKARLDEALTRGSKLDFEEAGRLYGEVIKEVVMESYRQKPRSELLMRIVLNQALELTYGVPTADGRSVRKRGVLAGAVNRDLIHLILKDSIQLALQYYQDDRDAVEKGNLLELPYAKLATERLTLARKWSASVQETRISYRYQWRVLRQWMNTIAHEEETRRVRYAEEILRVDRGMKRQERIRSRVARRDRELRSLISTTLLKMWEKQGGGRDSTSVSTVQSVAGALDESLVGKAARFVTIPAGEFVMGSPPGEEGHESDEVEHRVRLTRSFEMQMTEVTQLQYFLVMGRNPSKYRNEGDCGSEAHEVRAGLGICLHHPVEQVSWKDAQKFIQKLNGAQTRYTYRLPTEAEWEYAARGGSQSPYSFGFNDTDLLEQYAWYDKNSGGRTHGVALKRPNSYGLYDMHGNVWEWVLDFYHVDYSLSQEQLQGVTSDPKGPAWAYNRVIRGGGSGSFNIARVLRSAYRGGMEPDTRSSETGFRLVRTRR